MGTTMQDWGKAQKEDCLPARERLRIYLPPELNHTAVCLVDSWSPFVGMFIAKISCVHPLREFLVVVVLFLNPHPPPSENRKILQNRSSGGFLSLVAGAGFEPTTSGL